MYYYVKGGRVDYGARMQLNMVIIAMVEHTRASCVIGNLAKNSFYRSQYGWSNHSSNGRILRNGNQEEIEYQRQHGVLYPIYLQVVKIIWLLQLLHLAHHIMVHRADKIGTRKLVKETINRIGRLSGGKDVDIDLGFLNGD